MPPSTLFLIPIAVLVGCLPPTQAGVNSTLARYWDSPLLAGLTNTVVATLVVGLAALVLRVPWPGLRAAAAAPWWAWLGGVFGAAMVLSGILIAPRLGAAAYVTAMLVGTVTASMVIDHFGLVGFREHPVSFLRLLGGGLVLLGMLLVRAN